MSEMKQSQEEKTDMMSQAVKVNEFGVLREREREREN
jgi:hypothetical protein